MFGCGQEPDISKGCFHMGPERTWVAQGRTERQGGFISQGQGCTYDTQADGLRLDGQGEGQSGGQSAAQQANG